MAKKNKRQSRKISTSAATAAVTPSSVGAGGMSTRSTAQDFSPDYTYVRKDLKRIGILAASMFLFLVVMAFVLPMVLYR